MCTVTIRGIPVVFPCEPYDIQKEYMSKVIECLQTEVNGVLESPTGTGKTLSLLCSSLAWLQVKKAQVQAKLQSGSLEKELPDFMKQLNDLTGDSENPDQSCRGLWGLPTIIYASRTHSQLSQAMQELKRTSYSTMKATCIGSREQMCIHPEVSKLTDNSSKIHMCKSLVQTRSCHLYNRVEKKKLDPAVVEPGVMDIEDLVKTGEKHKFCPYFMAKELSQTADIVFMPYNYLLDPKARKAQGVELRDSIVILDEAHNIERLCEEAASAQIKTTDIALCIDEVTTIMRLLNDDQFAHQSNDIPKDFNADELIVLKSCLLDLEKSIDSINIMRGNDGSVYDGSFVFEILQNAGINDSNCNALMGLNEKLIQFLATAGGNSPFARKGNGLQIFDDFLRIVFQCQKGEDREAAKKCFKVHALIEEPRKKPQSSNWFSKTSDPETPGCKVISFWCFSPKFGMKMLLSQGVRCIILTSGTLSPMRPLLVELGIQRSVVLENPHIISKNQICVKILSKGPDGEILNSSYQNRNNQKYLLSLGQAIFNLTRMVPDGLLIFFPSYPLMNSCTELWQSDGIWTSICQMKPVFIEPRNKDAFASAMSDYYAKIKDPQFKGAIFMAVCRGKVSEGLDFADTNGRAVIVTGLPYPPMKDPRVSLKMKYLDLCNATDKHFLTGMDWYSLEASRAINQAIGRVIRHKNDYGAILLLDTRFNGPKIRQNLSSWLRDHVQQINNFGQIVRDMRDFFKYAKLNFSEIASVKLEIKSIPSVAIEDVKPVEVKAEPSTSTSQVSYSNQPKKLKMCIVSPNQDSKVPEINAADIKAYINLVKKNLDFKSYDKFINGIALYRSSTDYDAFIQCLNDIFIIKPAKRFILQGLVPFIKDVHKDKYELYWNTMKI